MAKGKHAAALFEVIHKDKRFEHKTDGSGGLRTPKWWFKGRDAALTTTAPVLSRLSPLPEVSSGSVAPQAKPPLSPADMAAAPAGRFQMAVDPDRQQIALRLNYTTAIIAAFAVLVVVGLAYIIGRHVSRGPTALLGSSIEQIKSGPAQPAVLDVSRDPELTLPRPAPAMGTPATEPRTWTEPRPPTTLVEQNSKRTVNFHYVIVQSYPPEEQKLAMEAREALFKAGILCTVEKAPAVWAPSKWLSVIGVTGFERTKSQEFEEYKRSIEAVSAKLAVNSKFKKLEPKAYKWRESQ